VSAATGAPDFDVIIVLGAALGPEGDLGPVLAERVYHGVAAFRAGRAPMMLMTGKYEAAKMKTRAVKHGVPADAVLVEATALTTRDNAVRCAEIMGSHAMRRALVVTQRFHQRRAIAAFRACGVDAAALDFEGISRVKLVLREVVAYAVYKARGWV
jgi:vancomycin permeability regulator SanA